ncbi:phage tail tape measure protein [Alphaproteobacteria bacterium GH1-50]|uniref:Phage tail tape measure protein n=1 Tax=Kangsaoukella pontilimi TaxID=2691042 RepID=A0A7C9MFA1_9RHOB|nr:phage tail tape measure protein [Kangsaoukella pontilimi]MXQ07636.1 phage tail tape measure protein [Kangsaoukella pontilimi]
MADIEEIDALDEALRDLEAAAGGAGSVTAAFASEVEKMSARVAASGRDVDVMSKGLSRGLKRAFDDIVLDGGRASDVLSTVAQSLISTAYSAAIKPVTNHLGGLLAEGISGVFGGAFADGASFAQGRVTPFATGGVVSGATAFPMRGGWGLMGEAGPEAIMPLSRGADGKLGVRAAGGARPVQVVVNVTTPDVQGFQRSQSQIAAQLGRALSLGQRNM